jgi:hypothetical protein
VSRQIGGENRHAKKKLARLADTDLEKKNMRVTSLAETDRKKKNPLIQPDMETISRVCQGKN